VSSTLRQSKEHLATAGTNAAAAIARKDYTVTKLATFFWSTSLTGRPQRCEVAVARLRPPVNFLINENNQRAAGVLRHRGRSSGFTAFQRHQAPKMMRESKPFRVDDVSSVRDESHQSRKAEPGDSVKLARPMGSSTLNQTSRPNSH